MSSNRRQTPGREGRGPACFVAGLGERRSSRGSTVIDRRYNFRSSITADLSGRRPGGRDRDQLASYDVLTAGPRFAVTGHGHGVENLADEEDGLVSLPFEFEYPQVVNP